MNNALNPFGQIQYLLNEINGHVYKINEIINQMNSLLNQMNNPMFNQINDHINNMNNLMNELNKNNMNYQMNNFNNSIQKHNVKDNFYINAVFNKQSGETTFISIDENKTIKELLNVYFYKNNRPDLVDNYDNKFKFFYNAQNLANKKEKIIKNYLGNPDTISVQEI